MSRESLLNVLLHDEAGFIISAELVLVATTVVIGMVAGLTCVRNAVVAELTDVGQAFNALNQSYCYTGFSARKSFYTCAVKSRTAGSRFMDVIDDGDAHADFAVPSTGSFEPIPAAPAPAPPAPAPACPPAADPVPAPVLECPPALPSPVQPIQEIQPSMIAPCPMPANEYPLPMPAGAVCPSPLPILPACPPVAPSQPW